MNIGKIATDFSPIKSARTAKIDESLPEISERHKSKSPQGGSKENSLERKPIMTKVRVAAENIKIETSPSSLDRRMAYQRKTTEMAIDHIYKMIEGRKSRKGLQIS